ncbi:MAG: aminoacyl-tRNA hydrolase [Christensenellaceae bacterium]|jgi:PTH1 family peptidyl-tRNA hydrolase|nr:aminoacyl-tRNA hydrolase [Christensenellaceae bacterium]
MKCWLIVGLGNPEGKYFDTWHNLGFKTAEKFAGEHGVDFKKKGNQLLCDYNENGNKVFILKPLTYMNLSGQAVVAVARKYKIAHENIIVFCDDIYIDTGNIRVTKGGSAGGHNGLKSVNELLGANDYIKVRIGAKPTGEIKGNTANYVLGKIPTEIKPQIDTAITDAVTVAEQILLGESLETIKGEYNKRNAE